MTICPGCRHAPTGKNNHDDDPEQAAHQDGGTGQAANRVEARGSASAGIGDHAVLQGTWLINSNNQGAQFHANIVLIFEAANQAPVTGKDFQLKLKFRKWIQGK